MNLKTESMNFDAFKQDLLSRLDKQLPENLYYHGVHHTIDVLRSAEVIADREGVKGEELQILKSAVLLHDIGYTEEYEDNEVLAVEISIGILRNFDYTNDQIELITKLILVTQLEKEPENLLEYIICDADFDYLGREDFFALAKDLRSELEEFGTKYTDAQWLQVQINFLTKHKYYTQYSQINREPQKKQHLQMLIRKFQETSR